MKKSNYCEYARFLLGVVALSALISACSAHVPTNGPELKKALEEPLILLVVMYLGALGSALKTVGTAKRDGAQITLGRYLGYFPETASAVIAILIAWATLLLADQLNFAAAAAYGAVVNTASDLIRDGGRSSSLMNKSVVPKE